MRLSDYMWNVYELRANNPAAENNIGAACDMLRANIVHGTNGNPGTDLDWAALNAEWEALTAEEQSAARDELRRVRQECVRLHMSDLYEAGNRDAFDKALDEARENAAKRKAAEEAAEIKAEATDEADG